jgi:DNA invertase Pin-like site-specific DNA recombinase
VRDRLARSTRDLLNALAAIADCKAGFRWLGDAWANTTTPRGRLMLTVLGGFGRLRERVDPRLHRRGRERAKARGVKMGRKPKLTDHQKLRRFAGRTSTARRCATSRAGYNVSHSTISRLTG